MNELEKVEQLVGKTGCSYSDAKEALAKADWDMLDAIIELEKSGKAGKSSASYSTAQAGARKDAGEYVEAERFTGDAAERMKPEGFSGPDRTGFGESSKEYGRRAAEQGRSFFRRVWDVLKFNYLDLIGRGGNTVLHAPLWLCAVLAVVWFWGVLIAALVLMLLGYSFHFEGRDFGKSNINETMDKASRAAYEAGRKVKESFASSDDASGGGSAAGGADEEKGR